MPLRDENIWCLLFAPTLILYLAVLTGTVNHVSVAEWVPSDIISDVTNQVLFPKDTPIELLTDGLEWAEGPLWVEDESSAGGHLLFSDTISNKIWRYDWGNGLFTLGKSLYVNQSGCSLNDTHCVEVLEPGSNGITKHPVSSDAADLVVCQHGDRAITLIYENGIRKIIANEYNGKKLNSPNDLAWGPNNNLYFTDPPYGLYDRTTRSELLDEQIGFYGVYMIRKEDIDIALQTGKPTPNVILLDNSLSRPNGIAFSTDFKKLYVSNSDSMHPVWMSFDVDNESGLVGNRKILADARDYMEESEQGLFPDGFKVSSEGIIVSSAPGGIYLISPSGVLLGKIPISNRNVANVAFGGDGYLYITATDAVMRVRTGMKSGI